MATHCTSILVIEDEAEIRENLKILLEMEGYRVFTASNGKMGLEIIRTMPRPCLVLLDLLMPIMTGEEFLKELKSEDALATIPVAIVSGAADKPKEVHYTAFIKKPVNFDGLMKFVWKYCGKPGEQQPEDYAKHS